MIFMFSMVDGFTMKVRKGMKIFILGCGAARHAGSSTPINSLSQGYSTAGGDKKATPAPMAFHGRQTVL